MGLELRFGARVLKKLRLTNLQTNLKFFSGFFSKGLLPLLKTLKITLHWEEITRQSASGAIVPKMSVDHSADQFADQFKILFANFQQGFIVGFQSTYKFSYIGKD